MGKQKFIEFIESHPSLKEEMSNEVLEYWNRFCAKNKKAELTELGKMVLAVMSDKELSAPQIATETHLPTKTVSCALIKLVNNGFVEKISQKPVLYKITQKGKDVF